MYFRNKIYNKEIGLFLTGASLAVFIFPLLFLQKGAVWNAIQPWYYFLILMNIFSAVFFCKLIVKKAKALQFLIIFLIAAFALPTSIKTFYGLNFKASKVVVGSQEIEAIKKLKEVAEEEKIVLLYPSFYNVNSSLVSALSGRRTFFAHEGQADLFNVNIEQEKEDIRHLFSSRDEMLIKSFLIDNKVGSVFLWKDEQKRMSRQFSSQLSLTFENKAASIYKVNNQ